MATTPLTTTISVFTRHNEDCAHQNNPQWKRCKCRKSLYIYEGAKVRYVSARTRSWEQAERVAQAERDARDPVKVELARIAAEEEAKRVAEETRRALKEVTVEDALDQWIKGRKRAGKETLKAYQTFKSKMLDWASQNSIVNLSDVTRDSLDSWVGSWSDALGTQGMRLSRLKGFFRWAHGLRKIDQNPAEMLEAIDGDDAESTKPLTPAQFKQLIKATYAYDKDRRAEKDKFGADLRAIFMAQRWTGLRLSDVLMLPKSKVQGNRITTKMQKTGDHFEQLVPVEVIEALNAVPVRKTMHPDQFFWSRKCDHRTLANMWTPRIRRMNKYVKFVDDDGSPLPFRSHMLRDTFAVELLLAGVSLDKVSKLLGHKSIRVTETHYAPWVKSRKDQLEGEMKAAMLRMGATFSGD